MPDSSMTLLQNCERRMREQLKPAALKYASATDKR
jgi:hypothetical protein